MKNFLIIKHHINEGIDYILNPIKSLKQNYEIFNSYKNSRFPDIDNFDFLIIMGGPMGVY